MKIKEWLASDKRYSKLCLEIIDDYFKWLKEDTQ